MREGERFLDQKYKDLRTSKEVEHENDRKRRKGEQTSEKPADKIADFLSVLEKTHMGHRDDPRVLERIKRFYHEKYVIKPEDIPQHYWNTQAQIMIREGRGADMEQEGIKKETIDLSDGRKKVNYHFPEDLMEQNIEVLQNNQKRSLDRWIDYLTSDDAMYPMWAKYWAFRSVLSMGKFEKLQTEEKQEEETKREEKARFQKRTKDTVSSFPLLNPKALAQTIGVMSGRLEEKKKPKKERESIRNVSRRLSDPEFQKLLSTENFAKLYAQFLLEMPEYTTEGLKEIRGEWKRYPQDSDPKKLVESLEDYPLEWCTADPDTAKIQLEGGDFHVYYSIDEEGTPRVPRLAIRMEGQSKIAEPPRGIAPNQNLDPYIGPVLKKKMEEFGKEGELYKKRVANMEKLTTVWEKNQRGEDLNKEDLRFLYEFDEEIEGFGYERDPRIEEVLASRDPKDDISQITGFSKDEISTTKEEALSGNIKYHYGDLDLQSLTSAEGLTFPESISGSLDLESLTSAKGLTLPKSIGSLDLGSLTSAEGLTLPKSIGSLNLESLTSAEGLTLPKSIGSLNLKSLTSVEGLTLPESIGSLNLGSLTSAEGLTFPESISGGLILKSLTSAEGLTLPKSIGGYLDLESLTSAEGLTLPESIDGDLDLQSLTSAKGLTLPESIGSLDLGSLTSDEKKSLKLKYPKLSSRIY